MDLLEYQGKQLLARHGIPTQAGRPARAVDEAVAAAEAVGYPCVIKAQVLVGGRGKAGGIKLAHDAAEARTHATAILGMDIRGFTVHEIWVGEAVAISEEYYASVVLDRSAKAPLMMLSTRGGVEIETVAAEDPQALATVHVDPAARLPALPRPPPRLRGGDRAGPRPGDRRLPRLPLRDVRRRGGGPRRGQPADRDRRAGAACARREGHARRQRPLSPPRERGPARHRRRRPAGADGARARPDLRQARRGHRDPRQRRGPRHVDARRRRPERRRAGQLPRRRGRVQGRGDHRGDRGDPLQPEGQARCSSTSSAASPAATRSRAA